MSFASPSPRSDPTVRAVGIAYVDGPRLARSLFAAAEWVTAGRDEINRINVFPVPDEDAGTNFTLTLLAHFLLGFTDALSDRAVAAAPDAHFGGSTVLAPTGDIHVHTDTPDAVFSYAARWGRVDTAKAQDMRDQHRRLAHSDRRAVAVVTDSSADLPDTILDRHRSALMRLQVVFRNPTFRDRVELKPEEFYRQLHRSTELEDGPGPFDEGDARKG